MQFYLAVFSAFTISLIACWIITRSHTLKRIGNVEPAENRWHNDITPGLGGVPIFLGVTCATLVAGSTDAVSGVVLLCAVPLLVLGLYDDIKPMQPRTKLLLQTLTALLFLVLVNSVGNDIFPKSIEPDSNYSVFYGFIFCTWVVGILNAFNLLDNMDGLAGGVALIASLTIAYLIADHETLYSLSFLYYLLAASLAGFLVLNKNPAKLFMGDTGSLWIGYLIAVGVLLLSSTTNFHFQDETIGSKNPFSFSMNWLLAPLLCTVPLSDTLMVMITRTLRGQPVSVGGKDHLSHRLVSIGFSEQSSVAFLWLIALIASALAIAIHQFNLVLWPVYLLVFFCMLVASIVCLVYRSEAHVV